MSLRLGGLCSGYGGLEMAVQSVLGGSLAWVADTDPGASRILTHHHPDVPNLGDITATDWAAVEPVDGLAAGFPCQPVSNAGQRRGVDDVRWIWPAVVEAARVLRPRVLFLENVAALVARGFDRVLADLAAIGFDAEWTCLRASDIGAPHRRERWFLIAWPADATGPRLEARRERRPGGGAADAHTAHLGHQRTGGARAGRDGSAHSGHPVAHASGDRRDEGRTEPAGEQRGSDVAFGGGAAAAHTEGVGHGHARQAGISGVPAAAVGGDPLDWGPYESAITRWERVTGRVAPVPTEPGRTGQPRLSPRFVEWLMGLPEGHVTTPAIDLTRTQQLHALGNGVVPQQGSAAIRLLLSRLAADHLHSLTT